ncbi:kielin/chordin-like protein [Saccoglossus kowalevskii]|uniref:von Willebrand factor-like n=1 Tax=Saccoglossus kowalevskii TaxID=10224 RepID=A0ABM0M7P8_SACKO|nr:PREDICTED: von Willebrand factor-like [Saccoglossus kowalevskii]
MYGLSRYILPRAPALRQNSSIDFSYFTGGTLRVTGFADGQTPPEITKKHESEPGLFEVQYGGFKDCDIVKLEGVLVSADNVKETAISFSTNLECPCLEGTGQGDPHYRTLDGVKLTYQGEHCSYVVSKDCQNKTASFEIIAVHGSSLHDGQVRRIIGTVVKAGKHIIMAGKGLTTLDGKQIDRKKTLMSPDLELLMYFQDGWFTIQSIKQRWFVQWSDERRFKFGIHADSLVAKHVCGILGNADGTKNNDMTMPNKAKTKDHNKFGKSWQVPGCEYTDLFADF